MFLLKRRFLALSGLAEYYVNQNDEVTLPHRVQDIFFPYGDQHKVKYRTTFLTHKPSNYDTSRKRRRAGRTFCPTNLFHCSRERNVQDYTERNRFNMHMHITCIVWYLGSANSLNSHGSHFKRATVGGMCAENLVFVVDSEKKTVLDLLDRQV
jgi:hypothetical protein